MRSTSRLTSSPAASSPKVVTFTVLIIPHTLKVTTLGELAAGDEVNLEVDLMARYAARLLEPR